jgi:hypothetical protein
MQDDKTSGVPDDAPATPDGQEVARAPTRTEKLFVRVSVWQTVLSVAGVFIGVVALYAALTESEAARKQTAATVWPYLQFEISDYANEAGAGFSIAFSNAGVGPARVREMQLSIADRPVTDWETAVARLVEEERPAFGQNFIIGRVLTPGESVTLVQTHDRRLVEAFRQAVALPGTWVRLCYCSIFDECWLRDSRDEAADPEPVEACPDFGAAAFRD